MTWGSPGCPQYCLDAVRGGNDLIPCLNVTSNPLDFCCDGVPLCCDGGAGRFRLDSEGVPTKTLRSAASTATRLPKTSATRVSKTSTSTSTAVTSTADPTAVTNITSSPAPASTPDPPSSSALSSGAKAGIGIGAALGAIIVLAGSLWWWRKKRSNKPYNVPQDSTPLEPTVEEKGIHYSPGPHEMPGEMPGERKHEMPVGHSAWEMPERDDTRSIQ
ncbi:MAG: hypothetical protein Q9213_003437 [Squamulea squamosa]